MWTATVEELMNGRVLRFAVTRGSGSVTVADVIRGWRGDATFRSWFNALLADVPFSAYRWETPAVATSTVSQAFEFVALDAPGLARSPDQEAFAEHFWTTPEAQAVAFPNLSGDAVLVVPCPLAVASAYGHLAAFVRSAPESQQDVFWRAVGDAMDRRMSAKPVWLSTAGAGVSWLHVRLDDRPKYYGHEPYRQIL